MKKEKISGLTAVYRKVKEGYIAYVEEMPGINTQGDNLKEAKENLLDALKLVLEVNREIAEKEISGHAKRRRKAYDFLQSSHEKNVIGPKTFRS